MVMDKDNGVLPGVSVRLKGTSTAVVTDIKGMYTISVPGDSSVLVFTYVGYTLREEVVKKRRQINVIMSVDSKMLNEIAVIG